MTVTISSVRAFQPDLLTQAGERCMASANQVRDQGASGHQSLTSLMGGWEGSAADSAVAAAETNLRDQQKIEGSLQVMAANLIQGGATLGAQRDAIVETTDSLEQVGYQVSDDGSVSVKPGSRLDELARLSPINRMQIEAQAAAASNQLKQSLAQFESADAELASQVMLATGELDTIEPSPSGKDGPKTQGGALSPPAQPASFATDPFSDDADDVFPDVIDPGGAGPGDEIHIPIPPELI